MGNKLAILAFLLFPGICYAQTAVSFYVNTDCANDGDGTSFSCAASAGAAGAYNSLCNANSNAAKNLVTANEVATIYAKGTAEDSPAACINGVNLGSGWTLDSTHTLTVSCKSGEANSCASGGKDTSAYRVAGRFGILPSPNTIIDNIQVISNSDLNEKGAIYFQASLPTGDKVTVKNSRVWTSGTGTSLEGIRMDFLSSGGEVLLENNIVFDCPGACYIIQQGAGSTVTLQHNTCYNDTVNCFYLRGSNSTDTLNFYNNLADGTGNGIAQASTMPATVNAATNATDDTTSIGTGALTSKTFTFVDETNRDLHLASGDSSGAISGGTDRSVATDIDGDTRDTTPDIGADEQASSGGSGFTTSWTSLYPLERM